MLCDTPTRKGGVAQLKMLQHIRFLLAVLAVVSRGQVPECSRITGSDLGNSDAPRQSGLIAESFVVIRGENAATPSIQLVSFHIVCEAAGRQKDGYRYVSLIANYTFNSMPAYTQFDYQCVTGPSWSSSVAGSTVNTITSPPDGDYSTQIRRDCGLCISSRRSTFSDADITTHCLACPSTCHSLNRCTSLSSCCNFYNNNFCVDTCPQNSQSNSTYDCVCLPGFTRDMNLTCVDINECSNPMSCFNGGTCTNTIGSFSCTCPPMYTGSACESDVDECVERNPCTNGATCVNVPGSYSCVCAPGYTGMNCEDDIDECVLFPGSCRNGGTCVNSVGSFDCNCLSGFTGLTCDDDVDECISSNPCLNGGTCSNTVGSFSCSCPPGYTGEHCEDNINECDTISFPCMNGGTCVDTPGSYSCVCMPGYTGDRCEDDVDECTPTNPCANGGSCVNSVGDFMCTCPVGRTGRLCEDDINECSTSISLCANGAVCENTEGSFVCRCASGYSGDMCDEDIDECSPTNPCNNAGTCFNSPGSFSCSCQPGYTGTLCGDDVDECNYVPAVCLNGGSCINTEGSFVCECPRGVSGDLCEEDIDECEEDDLCSNGGTCVNSIGSYMCQCGKNWGGLDCTECILESCLRCSKIEGVCEQCESGYVATVEGSCIPCSVEFCSVCTKEECTTCNKGYSLDVAINKCIVGSEDDSGGGLSDSLIIGIILGVIILGILLAALTACIILGVYRSRETPRMSETPKTSVFAAYGEHHNPLYLDAKDAIAVESGEMVTLVKSNKVESSV